VGYAKTWRGVWCLLTAAGVGLSMLERSPAMTLLAVLLLSMGATTVLLVVQGPPDALRHPGRGRVDIVRQGIWTGSGVVAATAMATASPSVALLLAVVALGTAPWVLRRCAPGSVLVSRRPEKPSTRPMGAPVGPSAGPSAPGIPRCDEVAKLLGRLSDGELCRLWRSTFWELKKRHTADECLTLVTLRGCCLDEMDRRDPSGLRAWLESGARASGGPERFLNVPHDPGSAAAA